MALDIVMLIVLYADCHLCSVSHIFSVIMSVTMLTSLSVIMLTVIMLTVIMLTVIMLNVIMLNIVMLNVIMLNVV
jgi:hypothetical protein